MMQLSDELRKVIGDELRYVAKKIKEETDLSRKNYFFSASFGVMHRIANLEFDPSLMLLHMVLHSTHAGIESRLASITSGQERVIQVPPKLFDSLSEALGELADKIQNNEDLIHSLQKIATIAYVTTGNGYYLYEKGILKI